jgi:glycosyltransferase involved in cell wall biosynthesis
MNNCIALICNKPNEVWISFLKTFIHYPIFIIINDNSKKYISSSDKIIYIQIDGINCKKNFIFNTSNTVSDIKNWDKALYYFSLINLSFDNIWFIEDSVFFYNETTLLNIDLKYNNSDLLSKSCTDKDTQISNKNKWHWRKIIIELNEPYYRSMCNIVRISNRLMNCIKNYAIRYKTLFFIEALFPTLCKHNNLINNTPIEFKDITYNHKFNFQNINKKNFYNPIRNLNNHIFYRNILNDNYNKYKIKLNVIYKKIIIFVSYCKVYEPFIIKCLSSIKKQNYPNYEVIIINDGSKNIEIINESIKDSPNYTLINFENNNDTPMDRNCSLEAIESSNGPAFSKWKFIEYIQKNIDKYNYNDIVMIIDGDDYIEEYAFNIINDKYQSNNCWVTYGNARGRFCEDNNYDIPNTWKNIRKEKWIYNHPRTCKLFLLTKFIEDDFKMKGKWLIKATDATFIYNCIEWSGISKCKFINKILYNYVEHKNNTYKTINHEVRMKNINYVINKSPKKQFIEDIHIVMCCWKRTHMLEKIIQNMNEQTVANRINIHLLNNNENNIEILKDMIIKFKNIYTNIKIYLSHYDNKYYGFQRFIYIKDILIQKYFIDYVIIIDDDQLFSNDWVEKIYKLKKPKTYLSWYGKVWSDKIDYWNDSILSINDCENNNNKNIYNLMYGATCGSIIDVNIFNENSCIWNIPDDLPQNISVYNIEDLWLSFIIIYEYNWNICRSFLPPNKNINYENNKSNSVSLFRSLFNNKQTLFEYLYNKYIFNSVKSNI